MDEPVRWVTKAEAAEELEVSLSTLDRMIGRRDVEVRGEGRRVFVRMHGPEHLSDEELLRRAIIREEELTPNPPKDTDGRREDSGRGWVRELQGRWPGVLG